MNPWYTDSIDPMGSIYFMRKDKDQAFKLRKKGYSYNQISQKLSIPKSTLSTWLRDVTLSPEAQKKIEERVHKTSVRALIERNKRQTHLAHQRSQEIRKLATQEYKRYMNDPLFISGVALYWAEGYKKGADGSKWKSIDFANSDPDMIVLIIRFFEAFLHIDKSKIKLQIIAHKNVVENEALQYWQKITKVPIKNFMKVSYTKNNSSGKRTGNRLPHGTLHVRINNVELFFKLIGWIDGMKKNV